MIICVAFIFFLPLGELFSWWLGPKILELLRSKLFGVDPVRQNILAVPASAASAVSRSIGSGGTRTCGMAVQILAQPGTPPASRRGGCGPLPARMTGCYGGFSHFDVRKPGAVF
jgi:hypothetical protein